MTTFHFLQLENVPIYRQLQIEEALLRADQRNWCLINRGSPPAIVMGISGKPAELINLQALQAKPLPIIRRFSGGGTVVVDEDTFFITWIANRDDVQVACCPKKVMEWTASLYRPAFGTHDFHLLENDYAIGNRKCGGNAQYLCKGRWLHHSSLLWDYQSHRMDLLTLPPKMPVYRQRRQHEDFLCRLSSYFKSDVHFSEALLAHLHSQVSLQPVAWELVERLLASPHRKATELCDLFAYSATT